MDSDSNLCSINGQNVIEYNNNNNDDNNNNDSVVSNKVKKIVNSSRALSFTNDAQNSTNLKSNQFYTTVATARAAFATGRTRDVEFRLKQLKQLLRMYEENNDEILLALKKDMRKSKLEGYLYEVDLMKNDARSAIRNLKEWTKTEWLHRNWLTLADIGYISRVPYGVVLVIGPWNYPFQLTLVPVCGAIAAGNCVIIKPSEVSCHSAAKMAELIPKYLDPECYQVVQGGPEETQELLKMRFDYIFYTGSLNVGKKIHEAATRYLTPTTLELGGKSPVYVDSTVNFAMAARRIMWGKCMNMGQTCVAPDYILCSKEVEDKLVDESRKALNEWYGSNWKTAKDLARIINKRHFDRLSAFLKDSGRVAVGGETDEQDLWIEPTILVDVKPTDPIMQDEVFGPILPIVRCDSPVDAIKFINSRPNPLCLYVFSKNGDIQALFENSTTSGTMAFNDTIVQFAIDELPFGGIGDSGMGSYHGKFSFDTFTHNKSVVLRDYSYVGDQVGVFRYPPYSPIKINFLSFLLHHWKKFKVFYFDYVPHFVCFLVGIALVLIVNYLDNSSSSSNNQPSLQ